MKDQRKNTKKRGVPLALYLTVCLAIIVSAYFHLSRIAQNFNTQHLELITGLYAEKMNESMEYLQNYVKEDVKMIQAMENKEPEKIQKRLEKNLNQKMFCNVGFILKNGEVYGSKCAVADIKKKNFDKQALSSAISFNSDPYQSSETGNMIMTVFVPVAGDSQIRTLYVSIMIEQLRKLGVYELLQGKISVHLLKVDSENFITCISSNEDTTANGWNNLLLQQKYFKYDENYSYKQWIKDMRSAKKEGRFAAQIKGEDSTISYRSISGMPGWYVVVELTNKNISDITQHFSVWGGVYGSILVGFTILYMLMLLFMEKKEKKRYIGLSSIDALTGILNRRAFQVELEEQIRKKEPGFFIFIDVDNFKSYNDTYGHNNGDLCLKHFTKAMQECFPEGSILGRYGGDEFVVYLKDVTKESVYIYMEKFQKMIVDLTLATGEQVHLSASAGGAAFPEQGEDFISLCRSADAALYNVKQNGKGAFKMK